jgi:hypothetical protein
MVFIDVPNVVWEMDEMSEKMRSEEFKTYSL